MSDILNLRLIALDGFLFGNNLCMRHGVMWCRWTSELRLQGKQCERFVILPSTIILPMSCPIAVSLVCTSSPMSILDTGPANQRRRYCVTPPLTGRKHTQNSPRFSTCIHFLPDNICIRYTSMSIQIIYLCHDRDPIKIYRILIWVPLYAPRTSFTNSD